MVAERPAQGRTGAADPFGFATDANARCQVASAGVQAAGAHARCGRDRPAEHSLRNGPRYTKGFAPDSPLADAPNRAYIPPPRANRPFAEASMHYPRRASKIKRARKSGFRARMRTRNGRKTLSRKRRVGRSVNVRDAN